MASDVKSFRVKTLLDCSWFFIMPPTDELPPVDPPVAPSTVDPLVASSVIPNSSSSISQSSSLPGTDSVLSPYYLHHKDNTGLVLVNQLLAEENYISWSRSIMITLFVKNKLGFIDGTITHPSGDLLLAWIRNNNVVIAWILNSVSKEISSSILFSEFARDIWIDLKERFEIRNGPQIFQLKRQLATLSQDQNSVSHYFTKLKSVWDKLQQYRSICSCCTCGGAKFVVDFLQYEYLMNFLMGLNESYANTHAQLLLMDPPPSIDRAFSLVNQEEQQRSIWCLVSSIHSEFCNGCSTDIESW